MGKTDNGGGEGQIRMLTWAVKFELNLEGRVGNHWNRILSKEKSMCQGEQECVLVQGTTWIHFSVSVDIWCVYGRDRR